MTLATLPSESHLRRVPCAVYVNPSDLDVEANYGTLLGLVDGSVDVIWHYETDDTISEPFGTRPTAKWVRGIWADIEFNLQAWNNLTHLFPGLVSGGDVRTPASIYAGVKLSSDTYKKTILVMPLDECAVNPCVLAQYAVVTVTPQPVRLASGVDATHRVRVSTFPKPSATEAYRDLFIGDKANATIIA